MHNDVNLGLMSTRDDLREGIMATATISATHRFDDDVKREATDPLDTMGISLNGYLNMAVRQLINQRRIPFDIVPAREIL